MYVLDLQAFRAMHFRLGVPNVHSSSSYFNKGGGGADCKIIHQPVSARRNPIHTGSADTALTWERRKVLVALSWTLTSDAPLWLHENAACAKLTRSVT